VLIEFMKWSEYKNKEVALNIAKSSRQRNGNNVFILLKCMYYILDNTI
jgi:hypothetical protein